MKFELSEYHQGVSVEELILDVQKVAKTKDGKYLSTTEYMKTGKYSETTFRKRIGSWYKVLELAGLSTVRTKEDMKRILDDEMRTDIILVCKKLNINTITFQEYNQNGKYSSVSIIARFGSWAKALKEAGLAPTNYIPPISDQELFSDLENVWIKLGRQPTTDDMRRGASKYSLDTYMRRFGGWRRALSAFVNYINEENIKASDVIEISDTPPEDINIDNEELLITTSKNEFFKHWTTRNINLRLRFQVMQRDNFKCCACGATPAKDPSVELHVDHILPWSKNGETTLENLQTLCSKCNLGKSDVIF